MSPILSLVSSVSVLAGLAAGLRLGPGRAAGDRLSVCVAHWMLYYAVGELRRRDVRNRPMEQTELIQMRAGRDWLVAVTKIF